MGSAPDNERSVDRGADSRKISMCFGSSLLRPPKERARTRHVVSQTSSIDVATSIEWTSTRSSPSALAATGASEFRSADCTDTALRWAFRRTPRSTRRDARRSLLPTISTSGTHRQWRGGGGRITRRGPARARREGLADLPPPAARGWAHQHSRPGFANLDRYVELELSGTDADAGVSGCVRTSKVPPVPEGTRKPPGAGRAHRARSERIRGRRARA